MRRRVRVLLCLVCSLGVLLGGCGYEPAGTADDGGGRRGVTEFRDKWGRYCTVVQPFKGGNGVALDCDWGRPGEAP